MRRLTPNEKELIIKLIWEGVSLNKISLLTKRRKSVLYYYYKKIKGKKYKEPQFEITFSESEGEIVGIFAGDGSQYYAKSNGAYQVNVHFGNVPEYISYVKELYESYFGKKWAENMHVNHYPNPTYRIRVSDKKIYFFFWNYLEYVSQIKHCTVRLKTMDFPKKFKIGFLRGLLDTDGCVYTNGKYISIRYYTTSSALAEQICSLLSSLGIVSSLYRIVSKKGYKDIFVIQIWAKSKDRFLNMIKPFKARKLGR